MSINFNNCGDKEKEEGELAEDADIDKSGCSLCNVKFSNVQVLENFQNFNKNVPL